MVVVKSSENWIGLGASGGRYTGDWERREIVGDFSLCSCSVVFLFRKGLAMGEGEQSGDVLA